MLNYHFDKQLERQSDLRKNKNTLRMSILIKYKCVLCYIDVLPTSKHCLTLPNTTIGSIINTFYDSS